MSVASLNRAHGEAELALALAAAGLAVIPVHLHRQGERWCKDPLIKDWRNRASADARMVQGWWRQFPFAVPGIVLARCGLVIVDADRHPGTPDGVAALAVLGALPAHPVVATRGGGEHHYFRQPDPPISFGRWLGGEVLGTSKFAVAYGMIDPAMVPALPAGLLRALPKHETRARRSEGDLSTFILRGEGALRKAADATAALREIDARVFNDEGELWFNFMMGAKAAGIGCEDFIDWSTQDPDYAGHGEIIRKRWNSAPALHAGAFYAELKRAGIKLTHTHNTKYKSAEVPLRADFTFQPSLNRESRFINLIERLKKDGREDLLFWTACELAGMVLIEGWPRAHVARGMLEEACRINGLRAALRKVDGTDGCKQTIDNAFAHVSNKLEPQS
jgi:Bifunctional DNA primase/polymerase, N-terminal/Primase C terminal 2 (PriCT-2)